ncbi:efflux transporter outer membrane subunit [Cupriavidus necator]|uniref:efflux transporter outer membrane subunit n=1 Tax=Cupriavidus necator TaxID=106590 RepID=UPI001E512E70|nr:efflux transporter outer membrane subunit [Cupriavidus necator]
MLLLAAALLGGCVGPRPPVPAEASVTPPLAWRVEAGPSAPIEREWWQQYADPMLAALVDRALRNNDDVGIAVARVNEARALEGLARAQLLPTLDFALPAARARSLNAVGRELTINTAAPQLQAAYEVDLFGRLGDQAEATRENMLARQAAHDTVVLAVAAATARSYITLRALDAQLEVVRQTLVSRAEALRLADTRARAGYTSQLELEQARAEYESTAQAVPQAELAIARQENALSQLVGDSPPVAIERGVPLSELHEPPVPEGLPADLLRRRPDIAQAEFDLAATDASLSAARKAYLPQLHLSASGGLLYATRAVNPVTIWSLGGSVLAPIFEGGRIQANADAAAARRDQAAFAYRRVVLTAFREVNDNLAALQKLDEQVQRLQLQRNALAATLRHATNRYRAGYSPYLEQLDAQRGLLNAELSLVQARADRLNASVALYQAMGGGWRADATLR